MVCSREFPKLAVIHVKGHVHCCELAVLLFFPILSPLLLLCWLSGEEYVALTNIFPTTMENAVENEPKNVVRKLFQKFAFFILKSHHKAFTRLLLTLNIRIGWLWFFFPFQVKQLWFTSL